jgi:hypothetical protein
MTLTFLSAYRSCRNQLSGLRLRATLSVKPSGRVTGNPETVLSIDSLLALNLEE